MACACKDIRFTPAGLDLCYQNFMISFIYHKQRPSLTTNTVFSLLIFIGVAVICYRSSLLGLLGCSLHHVVLSTVGSLASSRLLLRSGGFLVVLRLGSVLLLNRKTIQPLSCRCDLLLRRIEIPKPNKTTLIQKNYPSHRRPFVYALFCSIPETFRIKNISAGSYQHFVFVCGLWDVLWDRHKLGFQVRPGRQVTPALISSLL